MTSSSHFRSTTYKQTLKNKTNFLFMKLVGRSAGAHHVTYRSRSTMRWCCYLASGFGRLSVPAKDLSFFLSLSLEALSAVSQS